ncbi:MAG: NH(3)-dependent NAD(+) synthetase [Firmicutes bacterium ADurb.Bin080]|jgi:NAD+ synthase|nr:MAG: NH(3)-dependent NAD(+) synthetase [Firmicutes bacterium ADurb.Bin080]
MDINREIDLRVAWIRKIIKDANAKGVVLGMSGGKDCALVGILCKKACENVTGIIMPCDSKRNYLEDRDDARLLNEKFGIKTLEIDLTPVKQVFRDRLFSLSENQKDIAYENINPRLRMITLYNYAQREGYLVAGTGNLSERTMGYFTKWGDGAYDFNPIGDMTVSEVYEMLRFLDCPEQIIQKAPSAGLFDGQTDEGDMGITYKEIDKYIREGKAEKKVKDKIECAFLKTAHKRDMGRIFPK